jgi:hypothetical protein
MKGTLWKLFRYGYTCFFAGKFTPSSDGSISRHLHKDHYHMKEWQRGWDAAYFDNLKANLIREGKPHEHIRPSRSFQESFGGL